MLEKLVLSWKDGKTVPESYVFPPGQRPGEEDLTPKTKFAIPLIDLSSSDHHDVVRQILEASQEFGAFQVMNHGVPIKLMNDARQMFKEFFELSAEEKSKYITWDPKEKFALYTSNINYHEEKIHYWRDVVTQTCAPLEECLPYWPNKPDKYREIVGEYTTKARELGLRLLDLIAEGLGLEQGYFWNELSQEVVMNVNHYPACPDPTLTLGAGTHSDRSLITIVMQADVSGLQFLKDGQWVPVDPVPDVFCINLGYLMEIISNGRTRRGEHRAVTNPHVDRESAAFFLVPTLDSIIEPAKTLINDQNPPRFRAFHYHELLASHNAMRKVKVMPEHVLKPFMIIPNQ